MNIVPRRFFLDDLFNDFDEGSIKPVKDNFILEI